MPASGIPVIKCLIMTQFTLHSAGMKMRSILASEYIYTGGQPEFIQNYVPRVKSGN